MVLFGLGMGGVPHIETGSESVWEKKTFSGVFFSGVISKNFKRLTCQILKRNLEFSGLKYI